MWEDVHSRNGAFKCQIERLTGRASVADAAAAAAATAAAAIAAVATNTSSTAARFLQAAATTALLRTDEFRCCNLMTNDGSRDV